MNKVLQWGYEAFPSNWTFGKEKSDKNDKYLTYFQTLKNNFDLRPTIYIAFSKMGATNVDCKVW